MKKAILEICHVSKSFRHQSILSDGNMTVYEGELLYLCGKNGSGKSTIFKIIAGLLVVLSSRKYLPKNSFRRSSRRNLWMSTTPGRHRLLH